MAEKSANIIKIGNNNSGIVAVGGNYNVTKQDYSSGKGVGGVENPKTISSEACNVRRILALSASPKAMDRLRLDEEFREMDESLKRSRKRHLFEINIRGALRFHDLRRALLEIEPHIVHFAGHGGEEGLILEDKLGFPEPLSSHAAAGLFKLVSKHVECVVLNACYATIQAEAIHRHVRCVIGMSREIKDKSGIEFSIGFYDALGAGKSVEQAFHFGYNSIMRITPDLPEELTPKLYIRSE